MTCSLKPGLEYRVLNDFKAGKYDFKKNDILKYTSGGYSRYDECYIYNFIDGSNRKIECITLKALSESELDNLDAL